MASRYYDNRGKREWWSVHVEAWQRSGLSQVKYCNVHGLERGTFARWLNVLTDAKMTRLSLCQLPPHFEPLKRAYHVPKRRK